MGRLEFDQVVEEVGSMTTNAQATLMYRLVNQMGPAVLRSIIRYCCKRLDKLNAALPDEHPYKQKYLNYGRHNLGPATERNMPQTEAEKW